jgi:hypothetical protein
MTTRPKLVLPSIVLGTGIAAALEVASAIAHSKGMEPVSRTLSWLNTLLQDGPPLNLFVYFASLPLAAALYSVASFLVLSRFWNGTR